MRRIVGSRRGVTRFFAVALLGLFVLAFVFTPSGPARRSLVTSGSFRLLHSSDWAGPSEIYAADAPGSPHPLARYRNGQIAFAHLQEVAPPGLATVAAAGTGRSLLLAGRFQEPPVLSPDGQRVACVSGRSSAILYVARTDGRKLVRIGVGRSPSWSPDGSRLTFVSATGTNDIEVASADGSSVRSLGVSGLDPAWSPKGDAIAYFSSDSTVELIRPDGSGRTVLATDAQRFPENVPLAWSPDGAWLSFPAVNTQAHVLEVNVVKPDGSERLSLGNGWAVSWSPKADLLAFEASDDSIATVEIVAPDGTVRASSQEPYGTPVWSPDGRALAVGTPERKGVTIVNADAETLSTLAITGVPAWSSDGRRIAAVRGSTLRIAAISGGATHVAARGAEGVPLWLGSSRLAYMTRPRVRAVVEIEAERRAPRVLLHGSPTFAPPTAPGYTALAWSPNGSRLAFVRERVRGTELGVVSAVGTGARVLARGVTDTPAWSPDGTQLAFGANGLHVVRLDDGRIRRLTRLSAQAPAWSPDGRWIAFIDSGNDVSALYVIDRNGRKLRRLTDNLESAASWSPDGQRIAFDTDYGATAIETIRPDGTGLRKLVAAPVADETGDVLSEPRWSPDGQTILYYDDEYFCGSKCDELHLMRVRPNGTGRHRLPFTVDDANWSPDGRQLLGTGDATGTLLAVDLRTGRARFAGGYASAWSWQPLPR